MMLISKFIIMLFIFMSFSLYAFRTRCSDANGEWLIHIETYAGGPPPRPETIQRELKVLKKGQLVVHERSFYSGQKEVFYEGRIDWDSSTTIQLQTNDKGYAGNRIYTLKGKVFAATTLVAENWFICDHYWELRP